MNLNVRCEHCGKPFEVPREQAGQQGKCPVCGNSVYVKTPDEELQELPLAPEDNDALRRERQLEEQRRQLDRMLRGEQETAEPKQKPVHPATAIPRRPKASVESVVLAYLTAMRDSNLEKAEECLQMLRTRAEDARNVVDRLISDQLPPQQLANVPPGVYQGFLKSLSHQLH